MGARMVPANGQTTKTKIITNIYIRVQFLFSKRGGGVLLLGSVLLLGRIWYVD